MRRPLRWMDHCNVICDWFVFVIGWYLLRNINLFFCICCLLLVFVGIVGGQVCWCCTVHWGGWTEPGCATTIYVFVFVVCYWLIFVVCYWWVFLGICWWCCTVHGGGWTGPGCATTKTGFRPQAGLVCCPPGRLPASANPSVFGGIRQYLSVFAIMW